MEELVAGLQRLGYRVSQGEIFQLMSRVDVNHDGSLEVSFAGLCGVALPARRGLTLSYSGRVTATRQGQAGGGLGPVGWVSVDQDGSLEAHRAAASCRVLGARSWSAGACALTIVHSWQSASGTSHSFAHPRRLQLSEFVAGLVDWSQLQNDKLWSHWVQLAWDRLDQ